MSLGVKYPSSLTMGEMTRVCDLCCLSEVLHGTALQLPALLSCSTRHPVLAAFFPSLSQSLSPLCGFLGITFQINPLHSILVSGSTYAGPQIQLSRWLATCFKPHGLEGPLLSFKFHMGNLGLHLRLKGEAQCRTVCRIIRVEEMGFQALADCITSPPEH